MEVVSEVVIEIVVESVETFRVQDDAAAEQAVFEGVLAGAGFAASGEVPVKENNTLAKRNGTLNVALAANGPLLVSGSMEVVTGTGKTVNRSVSAAFCRCGQSASKPYCDGSHVRASFRAAGS